MYILPKGDRLQNERWFSMKTVAVCETKQRWFGMLCKAPVLCLSLVAVLVGCAGDGASETSNSRCGASGVSLVHCENDPEPCRNSCEGNLWPDAIIGIPPEAGNVKIRRPELDPNAVHAIQGCPSDFDFERRLCSWSFWIGGAPSEEFLVAHMPDGSEISTSLKVNKTKCARDIAYIKLVSSGTGWVWSTPEYINPCQKESN